jgi:hypothetical protein
MREFRPNDPGLGTKGSPMADHESIAAPVWEPRAVARARGLSDLLARRPELTGVYQPADVTDEAVRWSA